MRTIDPYRIFFPLGWLCGFIGVILWPVWIHHSVGIYPGLIHPSFMANGFFSMYVFGFILTALPKFTGTLPINENELKLAGTLAVIFLISLFTAELWETRLAVILSQFTLVGVVFSFLLKRFKSRLMDPPGSFIFIGVGFFLYCLGILFNLLNVLGIISNQTLITARTLTYLGPTLAFILGVGSRLIPALMGHTPVLAHVDTGSSTRPFQSFSSFWNKLAFDLKALPFILLLSFICDFIFQSFNIGDWIRFFITSYLMIVHFKIFKLPMQKSILSYFLLISCWILLLSMGLMAVFSESRLAIMHLLFVSAFGSITLMVSTRVTLSHGNQDMSLEKSSRPLLVSGVFVLFAGLSRASVWFWPDYTNQIYLIASVCWMIGLTSWALGFSKMWIKNNQPKKVSRFST